MLADNKAEGSTARRGGRGGGEGEGSRYEEEAEEEDEAFCVENTPDEVSPAFPCKAIEGVAVTDEEEEDEEEEEGCDLKAACPPTRSKARLSTFSIVSLTALRRACSICRSVSSLTIED